MITAVFIGPVDKNIHCANFSDLKVISVQPEDLLAA